MRKLLHQFISTIFIFLIVFTSCKKIEMQPVQNLGTVSYSLNSSIYDTAAFIPHDDDSIERITVLGGQLTNPYLIPNVTQAYHNLGVYNVTIAVTNLYVRFKPTVSQLAALDSTMDAQGLELFDTPVDYNVLYEGDYYQDPSITDSLPTWQYAVVPPNFIFPSGIQHETLAQIHIPDDNYTAVETEAERLAAIQDSINNNGPSRLMGGVQPNSAGDCPPGWIWDPRLRQCINTNCPAGYVWDGTQCVPYTPPPPAPDAAIPTGNILVHDTNLGTNPGVRKARVVARRWFKIERTYTDNNGHFTFTKKFKHKVKIIEKFKNDDARIYGIRGVRIWEMLFPIDRTLGIYSSDKSNIQFVNNQEGLVNSKGNRYWAAATTHDAVQEHRDYSIQFGFSTAPSTINIYITNWGIQEGLASTPLFHKRYLTDLPLSFINTFLVGTAVPALKLYAMFIRVNVDMAIDYHTSIGNFTSDWLKETVYHEMSHASHYNKVGTGWYTQFVNAELAEIAAHPGANDPLNPYGAGNDANAPIIALGEGWAYHMGHFLADQRYGVSSSCHTEQFGHGVCPNGINHPNIDVLENFIPTLGTDPFRWIPMGLMEDMMDNGEPVQITQVNDLVTGLTISQIFNALQSDVVSVPQYKTRLLQQIGNGQLNNINNLFISYGY